MSESKMRQDFCKLIASLDPVPIENLLTGNTGTGTPDVEFVGGWMELKILPRWPKRASTPARIDHYSDHQRDWMLRRWNAGEWAGLCLRVGRDWFVWSAPNAQRVGFLTKQELHDTADIHLVTPDRAMFTEALLVLLGDCKQQILTNPPSSR